MYFSCQVDDIDIGEGDTVIDTKGAYGVAGAEYTLGDANDYAAYTEDASGRRTPTCKENSMTGFNYTKGAQNGRPDPTTWEMNAYVELVLTEITAESVDASFADEFPTRVN